MRAADTQPPVISAEQADFFHDKGYLVLPGVLADGELRALRSDMDELTDLGRATVRDDPDFMYAPGEKTGRPILRRIEYVIDKSEACRVLLGHPFILRSVERLVGKDLLPTWDSMVLKLPGEGIAVPWHRDAGTEFQGDTPVFNVDFYLDAADESTCVWVYPGSHRWPMEEVERVTKREGFSTEGAIPVPMQPGDVLLHNILVLHGSPTNTSGNLRRVLYYEFRTAHVEDTVGPHGPAYIPLKQRVLLSCLEKRAACPYAVGETPFVYDPPAPYAPEWAAGTELPTYRYPHHEFRIDRCTSAGVSGGVQAAPSG